MFVEVNGKGGINGEGITDLCCSLSQSRLRPVLADIDPLISGLRSMLVVNDGDEGGSVVDAPERNGGNKVPSPPNAVVDVG